MIVLMVNTVSTSGNLKSNDYQTLSTTRPLSDDDLQQNMLLHMAPHLQESSKAPSGQEVLRGGVSA